MKQNELVSLTVSFLWIPAELVDLLGYEYIIGSSSSVFTVTSLDWRSNWRFFVAVDWELVGVSSVAEKRWTKGGIKTTISQKERD